MASVFATPASMALTARAPRFATEVAWRVKESACWESVIASQASRAPIARKILPALAPHCLALAMVFACRVDVRVSTGLRARPVRSPMSRIPPSCVQAIARTEVSATLDGAFVWKAVTDQIVHSSCKTHVLKPATVVVCAALANASASPALWVVLVKKR